MVFSLQNVHSMRNMTSISIKYVSWLVSKHSDYISFFFWSLNKWNSKCWALPWIKNNQLIRINCKSHEIIFKYFSETLFNFNSMNDMIIFLLWVYWNKKFNIMDRIKNWFLNSLSSIICPITNFRWSFANVEINSQQTSEFYWK